MSEQQAEEMKIEEGSRLKDNDPRFPDREVLVVIKLEAERVLARTSTKREVFIARKRIHTDGKPRRTGFTALPPEAGQQG